MIYFLDEASGIEITNPTMSTCGRFAVSPEVYGFTIEQTGGGCTAWVKLLLEDGRYLMLTAADDASHEIVDGQLADYGLYDAEGGMIELCQITVGRA